MAKWSLKNKQDTSPSDDAPQMPPELSNYYQSAKRDRMWGSWLLGFATLVVTVVIAAALFWGVRWVYREVTGDEAEVPAPVSQSDTNDTDTTSRPAPSESELPSDDTGDSSNEVEPEGVVDNQAAVTTNLPDTGPGNLITVFFAVAILGTLAHSAVVRQK